ncbi:uncharacterized protein TM35_000212520 [Trypanosoma theileri]|uniref:Transmembrane protein n=1 Tax=Trypanosoma theileri TaxID=67003 RepID=A0A1X0NSG9_9TRYP|nr:uncharacterized protein TM35_000212520 [Trypanosoma theileri]ORC87646.1 hypothetical protein TM35_000212520 [Trypanosoma theileri]
MRRCTAVVAVPLCGATVSSLSICTTVRMCSEKPRPYRSSTSFRLQPHEVNETNVPSAREVADMIPSRAELEQQLASARELEARYIHNKTPQTKCSSAEESPLWPNSDTVEEIMDEERYGDGEEEKVPPPSPQQILLAWKALMWGSLYALVGVTMVVCIAMYTCGMRSLADVLLYLRDRQERERRQLEEVGENVNYYVLDLTNPSTLIQQVEEIWQALEDLANETDEEEGKEVKSSGKVTS